jgi:dynein heavy chain 1
VKKGGAMAELEKVEPAVEEAKSAVNNIKRQHLDEIRTLARPPPMVQLTMEAVVLLLTGKKQDWNGIRKMLVDAAFIPSIIQFNSDSITDKTRQYLNENYFNDPKFNFENVNRWVRRKRKGKKHHRREPNHFINIFAELLKLVVH